MITTPPNNTAETKLIRVFHADDHPIVTEALAYAMSQQPDMKLCGSARDAQQALKTIPQCGPDIVVVDISMPGISGIELICQLRGQYPRLPIVVLSMLDETLHAERALRAGAKGYVMKTQPSQVLMQAIRKVLAGQIAVSEAMTTRLLGKALGDSGGDPANTDTVAYTLSRRELEVFRLVGQGYTVRAVAAALNIGYKTVESHCANIKRKLGLRNAVELQQRAALWVNAAAI